MRIGILTGGGDVPGLNPCIKAVVNGAADQGWDVTGIRGGWAGLFNYDAGSDAPQDRWAGPLGREDVRTIDRTGGTALHTSRTNPGKVRPADVPDAARAHGGATAEGESVDCTAHVLCTIEALGIDVLVPIGGDDTLSYAARLSQEGVPIVSIPKTMDNDVLGTDYCIGFSTAVTRSTECIDALRSSAGSHERIAVIELFGRDSGETALMAGYLTDAERTLISEVAFDMERLASFLEADRAANPSRYAIVVLSEGAKPHGGETMETGEPDAYGHRKLGGVGAFVSARLREMLGLDVLSQQLAYLMRSGRPDALDRLVATSFGRLAVAQIEKGETGCMVALSGGRYTGVPAQRCIEGIKRVDVAELYDSRAYRVNVQNLAGKPMFLY